MSEPRDPSDPRPPASEAGPTQDPPSGPLTPSSAPTESPRPSGNRGRIGPYRLLQKLGEGGMGEVYEAEQETPVRRRVALKVIKAGMDTREVVARFEAERQALALMNHPSIARVYDGGATPDGHPFFAMEYVKGEAITAYCDRHRLSTRERIELFRRVCDGVQHAHQKGVIHRDLKPGNVLVQIQDDLPVPKIIDFGVAKATSQKLTEKTMFTQLGMLVGTPEYMSPEQAEMTGLDVDTRTDVYSLGVMLYELLVGTLPFDSRALREGGYDEIRRRIREDEPARPSTKVTTLSGKVSEKSAELRRTTPPALVKELRGDLDWITMRALEKDRTRRYDSPAELGADLGRYLADEPVLAGPPSQTYRMGKFVRRHRLAVTAAGVVLVALLAGLSAAIYGLVRARLAEAKAVEEAATAERVTDFLVDLFAVSDPSQSRGNSITAREILDQGIKQLGDLADQETVQARLQAVMGDVYKGLGLYDEARPLLEKSLATRRRLLGNDHPATLTSMWLLAWLDHSEGRFAEAEALMAEDLEGRRRALGEDHPFTLETMSGLGWVLTEQSRFDEAEALYTRALEGQRRVLGEDDGATLQTKFRLGWLYIWSGRTEKAEPLALSAEEGWRRTLGDDHPATLDAANLLAVLRVNQGRLEEAEKIHRETLAIKRRVWGEEHQITVYTLSNLGELLSRERRFEEAEPMLVQALAFRRRHLGDDHKDTLESMDALGDLYLRQGRFELAEQYLVATLEGRRRALGEDHRQTLDALASVGLLYQRQGRLEQAEPLLVATLAGRRRVFGSDNPRTVSSMLTLADLYQQQGRLNEAEPLAVDALETCRRAFGDKHASTQDALGSLAFIYDMQERYAEAEPIYRDLVAVRRSERGDKDPFTIDSMISLAMVQQRIGSSKEAGASYDAAVSARQAVETPDGGALTVMDYNLSCLAAIRGERDDAVRFLRRAVDAGFVHAWVAQDPDLASLHGDPRFKAIVADIQARLASR